MNTKLRIFNIFLVAAIFLTTMNMIDIKTEEKEVSQEEIFEYIIKTENGFRPDEEVELTQEHYNRVDTFKTEFLYRYEDWTIEPTKYYLNDLSYLTRLNNLETLVLHIPTETNNFEYDLDYLDQLPYSTLKLTMGKPKNLSEEVIKAIQTNQRTILDTINPTHKIFVEVNKFGNNDNDFLIGYDLVPGITNIKLTETETTSSSMYSNFEYSHTENGKKIYKVSFNNPYLKTVTLDNNGRIIEDVNNEKTEWEAIINATELIPSIFYNKAGEVVDYTEGYWSFKAYEADKIDVLLSEEDFEAKVNLFYEELSYQARKIFDSKLYIEDQKQLLEQTVDPEEIKYIEESIAIESKYLADDEEYLDSLKTNRAGKITEVLDLRIYLNGHTDDYEHTLSGHSTFLGEMIIPENYMDTHTVTFESNGGTQFPQLTDVLHDSIIEEPMNPTKGDIEFLGWYKEALFVNKWDFDNDTVKSDITLYAKWDEVIPVTHTVTFDSKGGTDVDPITDVLHNEAIEAPAVPIKDGYTFDAWYIDEELETVWNFNDGVIKDMTLYAGWSKNVVPTIYTVKFDSRGGTAISDQSVKENEKVVKPNNPSNGALEFENWYTSSDYKKVWDFDTDLVTEDMTLYAKWKPVIVDPVNPTDPVDPTTPVNLPKEPEKTPDTGVQDNSLLYILLIALSATYLTVFLKCKKTSKVRRVK